jgi:DNA-binding IclR family transcriptional regulator
MREVLNALSSFGPVGTEVDFEKLTARLQMGAKTVDRLVEEAEQRGLVDVDREFGSTFPVDLELTEEGAAFLRL